MTNKTPQGNEKNDYIEPNKTLRCKLGFHQWCPVRNLCGASICMRCNLLKDIYGIKRIARVKKNGSVL